MIITNILSFRTKRSEVKNLGKIHSFMLSRSFATLWMTILAFLFLSTSNTEGIQENSPKGNFEALWHIIDTKYCFLDYKNKEYGLDWDEVYRRYSNRLTDDMSNKELFQVLAEMLEELRDGHVNLVAAHETSS